MFITINDVELDMSYFDDRTLMFFYKEMFYKIDVTTIPQDYDLGNGLTLTLTLNDLNYLDELHKENC